MTAASTIIGFEGFRSRPYTDSDGRLRIGYGSDTVTNADGTVSPVTSASRVTKADAQRDLDRRIPEFQQNGIIPYVGQTAWDNLPDSAKSAITSVAYNYGSIANLRTLQRAIRSGDTDAIAAAIKDREDDNNGVNADRRAAEAELAAGHPIPEGSIPGNDTAVATELDIQPDGVNGYKVKAGDTLSKIAKNFGTTVNLIASANGIKDPNKISKGQTLQIPGQQSGNSSTPPMHKLTAADLQGIGDGTGRTFEDVNPYTVFNPKFQQLGEPARGKANADSWGSVLSSLLAAAPIQFNGATGSINSGTTKASGSSTLVANGNGNPGAKKTTSGIAGTVQLPANVKPKIDWASLGGEGGNDFQLLTPSLLSSPTQSSVSGSKPNSKVSQAGSAAPKVDSVGSGINWGNFTKEFQVPLPAPAALMAPKAQANQIIDSDPNGSSWKKAVALTMMASGAAKPPGVSTPVDVGATDSENNPFGFFGGLAHQVMGGVDAIKSGVGSATQTVSKTAQSAVDTGSKLLGTAKTDLADWLFGSVAGRTAIIDPMIAHVFTNQQFGTASNNNAARSSASAAKAASTPGYGSKGYTAPAQSNNGVKGATYWDNASGGWVSN